VAAKLAVPFVVCDRYISTNCQHACYTELHNTAVPVDLLITDDVDAQKRDARSFFKTPRDGDVGEENKC
jgi:hypothetical protein